MNKYKYLISVIIPTRNRQIYAQAAVRHILGISKEIQIIVQDNSDNMSLRKDLEDLLNNEQIIYNYIGERIAGIDNYNIAASYAEGEFFCAIGDDDTVLPNIIDCAKWMKRNNIDAVKPSKDLVYWCPDSKNIRSKKRKYGYLGTGMFSGKCIIQNQYEGMKELLKAGGQGYLNLPIIGSYHGLVRTECMKKVYEVTGRYYGGLSPDMYSAACLSLLPNVKFVYIDFPISLPGVCPKSTSAQSQDHEHVGSLETAPHFIGLKQKYVWDTRIPKYYSVETIWAETLLKAISAMGQEELIEEFFSQKELIRALYVNNYEKKEEIIKCVNPAMRSYLLGLRNLRNRKRLQRYYKYFKKILAIFLCASGKELGKKNCSSIQEAVDYLCEFLDSKRNGKKWLTICNQKIQ